MPIGSPPTRRRGQGPDAPTIYVLAGVNGAGRSSIAGAAFRAHGADYFNPDEAAYALRQADPSLDPVRANALAWRQGVRLLERAIATRASFAVETTLGGDTITGLLASAIAQGVEVHVWFAGLSSPELHIERVRQRVRQGGHDIAVTDIRRRFEHSRLNLVRLLPHLAALRVYDNSVMADPAAGTPPRPRLLLHMVRGRIVGPRDLARTPTWAKAIVAAALQAARR